MRAALGKIVNVNDPLKIGRAKLSVPMLGLDTETDWAWRIQLPGVFFGPQKNDNVLVLILSGRVKETLFWLGPLDGIPEAVVHVVGLVSW